MPDWFPPGIRLPARTATFVVVACLLWSDMTVIAENATVNRASLDAEINQLEQRLAALRPATGLELDDWADAAVYAKAARWAVLYQDNLNDPDGKRVQSAIELAQTRLHKLEQNELHLSSQVSRGGIARGFVSSIDGSVQPVGVILPDHYDNQRPARLDVVLHGSQRPTGMNETNFLIRFEQPGGVVHSLPMEQIIEIHPLGRVENGYRWAGETDIFKAIDWACRQYRIDRQKIVLRGFSMGASGTWHVGLKHPDRFAAIGPYCGYVDTRGFSQIPNLNLIPVTSVTSQEEKMLHLVDAIDYAANAETLPVVACMGEKDKAAATHQLMREYFRKAGLELTNLISPGTEHVQDPVTLQAQLQHIQQHIESGTNSDPDKIRFVTWSLKYSRCHWIELLGLQEHYQRAEIRAERHSNGAIDVPYLVNISCFSIDLPDTKLPSALTIQGQAVQNLPEIAGRGQPGKLTFVNIQGKWTVKEMDVARPGDRPMQSKTPGIQGPIDDAFTAPFICVRGTGTPWSSVVQQHSEETLQRFQCEWKRYMRGDLPVMDDRDLTVNDFADKNLILFGDPGSNRWIAQALPDLPIQWTRSSISIGHHHRASHDHVPALILPNPFLHNRNHYLVINSGHSFGEKEFSTLNYLLYPRIADWAIWKVPPQPEGQTGKTSAILLDTDFFNE